MMDILWKRDDWVFSYRVAGICVQNGKVLLQKPTNDNAHAFPGGHVEPGESFVDAVVREMKEETGLTIRNPKLCGIKQFPIDGGRYIVMLYKTDEFSGELVSSEEGKMEWVCRKELQTVNLVNDFMELLQVLEDEVLTEFQYVIEDGEWKALLK